jgi:hypothetical protein
MSLIVIIGFFFLSTHWACSKTTAELALSVSGSFLYSTEEACASRDAKLRSENVLKGHGEAVLRWKEVINLIQLNLLKNFITHSLSLVLLTSSKGAQL